MGLLGLPAKNLFRAILARFGRDIAPHPLDEWYLLRNELQQLFTLLGINCVVDAGAHTGEYGTFLRHIGYRGFILSFEPVKESYEQLKARVRHDPRWRAFPYALGCENTSQLINVTRATVFSSFLPPSELSSGLFSNAGDVERTERVSVFKLDSVLDECLSGISEPRIYLKMDTQGWDLHVLAGSSGVLDRVLALQSEISVQNIYAGMSSYLDSLDRMAKLGFKPSAFVPVSRDAGLGVVEFNCVMVRAHSQVQTLPACTNCS